MDGFWPAGRPSHSFSQSDRQRALLSWQALRSRIALGVGPTQARWSTYSADLLSPEKITQYRKEAHTGYPWRWADLCEQVIERNSHIRALMHFRRAWAMSDVITWRIDASEEFQNDRPAQFIAAWQSAVLRQPGLRDIWADIIYQLLSASAYGYSAVEVFWDWRDIHFSFQGERYEIRSWVPVHMEFVHQKSFRFDLDDDSPGLYSADSSLLRWPMGKMLFHRCLGDGITERRGWMTAGVWIEYALQQGWADLLIYMHLYGIPQIAVFTEKELLDQGEERDVLDTALDHWGQGEVPVFLNEHRIEKIGAVEGQGDTIHPRVIQIAKEDLSVLITGSILAQTQGNGTGSYGATDQHAITAHVYRVPDGTQLANTISAGLLRPALHFNLDPLVKASGCAPWELRGRSGVFGWKANGPAPTVQEVIADAEKLAAMSFPVSTRELSQRTGWRIAEPGDELGGKPVIVPAGAASIGQIPAARGALGPARPQPNTSRIIQP